MLEELFHVYGLRNDNDNGSLVKRSNYGCADLAGAEVAWTLASAETACPQYYLAFDLTKNGMNSGIDLFTHVLPPSGLYNDHPEGGKWFVSKPWTTGMGTGDDIVNVVVTVSFEGT